MAKTKSPRVLITLECLNCPTNPSIQKRGRSRYHMSKNRKNTPAKLELLKYCPFCNKQTLHKEIK
jgi:large subunit ribosomal protein L33